MHWRFQASLTSSFSQTAEISKAVNSRVVSIGPARLQRISAYQIKAEKLKTFVGVTHTRAREIAQHIRFASARRAGTCAAQHFKFQKRFSAIIPRHRKFVSDLLHVGRFQA